MEYRITKEEAKARYIQIFKDIIIPAYPGADGLLDWIQSNYFFRHLPGSTGAFRAGFASILLPFTTTWFALTVVMASICRRPLWPFVR